MTDEKRDPNLLRLFAEAREDFDGEDFTAGVMARTDKRKSRLLAVRIGIGLVLAVIAITVQDTVIALAQIPVIELEEGLFGELLAPVNHLGALLSLGLILARAMYRKIFQSVQ